jgi:hypothetical protein
MAAASTLSVNTLLAALAPRMLRHLQVPPLTALVWPAASAGRADV